jgi:hypothetical protein
MKMSGGVGNNRLKTTDLGEVDADTVRENVTLELEELPVHLIDLLDGEGVPLSEADVTAMTLCIPYCDIFGIYYHRDKITASIFLYISQLHLFFPKVQNWFPLLKKTLIFHQQSYRTKSFYARQPKAV